MLITLKCVIYQFLSFTRNVGDTDVLLPTPVNFLSFSTSLASSQNYKLLLGEDKTRVVILVECSAVSFSRWSKYWKREDSRRVGAWGRVSFPYISSTTGLLWILSFHSKPVISQTIYINVYIYIYTHIYVYTHTHSCFLVAKSCPTLLRPQWRQPARLLCPWDFPERILELVYHPLFQGIFPTQGLNLHLLRCRWFFTAEPLSKLIKWKLQTNTVSFLTIHHLNLYKSLVMWLGKETCTWIIIRVACFHFTILWLLQDKTHTREYIIDFIAWSVTKWNGKMIHLPFVNRNLLKDKEKYDMTWDKVYHLN